MKITRIEISLEWDDSGEFEHESYCDSIEDTIRELKKLKKKYKDGNDDEEEW